jgi:hypothetical protein
MKYLIISILLVGFFRTNAQGINWSRTRHWKLYDQPVKKGFGYPLEKLNELKNVILDSARLMNLLADTAPVSSGHEPVWMGYYLASCETPDGNIKEIYVSQYGGFFYDPQEKKYYQLSAEVSKQWLDYFSDTEADLRTRR